MSLHDYERIQERLKSVADPVGFLVNLFAHAPVGFAVWTADGRALLTNKAFMDIFLAEPPPEYNVLKDDVLAANGMLALFQRAFAGQTVQVPTFWYDPRDLKSISIDTGRRVAISMTIFPLFADSGEIDYVAATYKDETEILLTHERLRLSEEQLRQAQKMEAVGRLAGGVAHDFNNVLSVILTYGELLLEGLKADDPMRPDIDEIRKAALRAEGLTRQLLLFSRQQVLEPKVVDLREVLGSMDKMLQRILGEDVELASVWSADPGRVRVDPTHIEQVILNLVVNARDAMPTGGKVSIEVANVVLDEAYAETHLPAKAGAYVMLAITDTGSGMDKATQLRIFEPFFTTKDKGKGTGLGLSTVFGIVQQGGGHIWVSSEPSKGTTFEVYLPRAAAEVDVPAAPAAPTTLSGTETILVVEDEDPVRTVVVNVLQRHGYRVLSAPHADEALRLCAVHSGTIDLLLTDVVMPKTSGVELAKQLLAVRPAMKVLYMSGYTDDSVVRHGVTGVAILQKPVTPASLSRKVREVLGSPP
jgi:two-component system, cell cycle sensor histidine kinase and response regulator CckA